MRKRKKMLLPLTVGLLLAAVSCPLAEAKEKLPVASASVAEKGEENDGQEEKLFELKRPARAPRAEAEKSLEVENFQEEKLQEAAKSQEDKFGLISELKLNIISPEERTVTAGELPSSIRIFVFGDLGYCGKTKGVMQQMGTQLRGMDVEVYYLDIKNRDAATIIRGARESQAEYAYLCEDKDKAYLKAASDLAESNYIAMPVILAVGKDNETLYSGAFSGSSTASVVANIKDCIIKEYPEEDVGLTPLVDEIYMVPGAARSFPIAHNAGYTYESSDQSVAVVSGDGRITAIGEGEADLTVKSAGDQATVRIEVIGDKEDYAMEWDVLKLVNAERMKQDLAPLSSFDQLQKAADVRSMEVNSLSDHNRPDGSVPGTVLSEVGIRDFLNYGENIAWGQPSAKAVMDSWMNSSGHRAQILYDKYTHVGVGHRKDGWVQFFLTCNGPGEEITLDAGNNLEVPQGGTISGLDCRLDIQCPSCGSSQMPVIDEMCQGFDPNKLGRQEVAVSLGGWSGSFTVTVTEKAEENPDAPGVDEEGRTVIYVHTAEELQEALKRSNVRIVLEGKDYVCDGGYYCEGAENVVIQGSEGTRLISTSSVDVVLSFYGCQGITLENLVLGHDIPTDDGCDGGVVNVTDSQVTIIGCDIFGCGLVGITADLSEITVKDSVIRDCSAAIMAFYGETTATFQDCVFSGNGYNEPSSYAVNCVVPGVTVNFLGCEFKDNQNPNFIGGEEDANPTYTCENCVFTGNGWDAKENPGNPAEPENKKVETLVITPSEISLKAGEKKALSVSVTPEDAGNKAVTWHSTDSRIAFVDEQGTVTAMARGTAEVYCVSQDGGNIESNRCKVQVAAYSNGFGEGISGGGLGGGGGSSGGSGGSGGSSGGGSGGSGGGGGRGSTGTASGTAAPSSSYALPSYVVKGYWGYGADGSWHFRDTTGKSYVNTWAAVENPYANSALGQQAYDWFRFDADGKMVVGWFYDAADGFWYYLNPVSDNTLGKMMTGWVVIDGGHYYFNPYSNGHRGRMYRNETTPDGYFVNEEGKWDPFR